MKSATQVLAAIAAGGVLAGGAAAVMQVPAPKTANTAAVTKSTGRASDQAIQQLTDESAQLHAAVASTQAQLINLRTDAGATVPTASPADLATLLAQTQAQLATAQQRLAADEALLAKLQPKSRPTTPTPVRTESSRQAETPSTTPVQQTPTAAAATTPPPVHRTHSASPGPTYGGGDD
jgi:paraquat-inducible protein B